MENNTATLLKALGIITIIVGVIASVVCGKGIATDKYDEVNKGLFLAICFGGSIASAISGIILYGFGEVIGLLGRSSNHLNNIESKLNQKPE